MFRFVCFSLVGHAAGVSQALSPRQLLRKEGNENILKDSPVDFGLYKFTVNQSREGQAVFHISDFFLTDQEGKAMDMNSPNKTISITNGEAMDATKLMDSNPSTSIRLSFSQPLLIRVAPGTSVGGFGFTTSKDAVGYDPTSFKLEGSRDARNWYLLNEKVSYDTPGERGARVGPFVVSKLATMALQGQTVPVEVTTVAPSERMPFTKAHPFLSSTASPVADAVVAPASEAPAKVTEAVVTASAAVGLDTADTAATAAAVSAAIEAGNSKEMLEKKVADAAASAGLTAEQASKISLTLQSVDPKHWDAILSAWSAAAKKTPTETPEEKVAAVVAASGEAGFTVAQQAVAAAASALPAALQASEKAKSLNLVGEALQGAELLPEGKAAVADAAAQERPENQEAIADVLTAAGMMLTTTTELPIVDVADPDARVILDAVARKLENAPISPEEKVKLASAAAEAYLRRAATTTSFDGVGMVVHAAEAAGLAHAQVAKIAVEAEALTTQKQLAAVAALRAAADGAEVLSEGSDPAEKVAAVVKAEAAAGVSEEEQAHFAAQAVAAAAAKAKKAKLAEHESLILTSIVRAAENVGLSSKQAEAILDVAASMTPEEQAVVEEYLEKLQSGPSAASAAASATSPSHLSTTTPLQSYDHLSHLEPSEEFMFKVTSPTSRSNYEAQTGMPAKGFVFGVSLDVPGVISFLRSRTGMELEPMELSLAYGNFLFTWPTTSCADDESGFTDFQAMTFYNASFGNPSENCGELLATTVDKQGILRLTSEGDQDLFRIAGMFGSKHLASGGDMVKLSILDLVLLLQKDGEKVEFRLCGGSLGCPASPLKIKYPENGLGQGVKICSGQSHFHEYKLQNCFTV